MSASSTSSDRSFLREGKTFVVAASAAMARAARQVAAENKRLGLPLIAEKPKRVKGSGGRQR